MRIALDERRNLGDESNLPEDEMDEMKSAMNNSQLLVERHEDAARRLHVRGPVEDGKEEVLVAEDGHGVAHLLCDEAAVLLAALGHVSAAVDDAQEHNGGHHHG